MDEILLPSEAAAFLHTPEATLQWWRHKGIGPSYLRIGRRIFYRKIDLDAFLEASLRQPRCFK